MKKLSQVMNDTLDIASKQNGITNNMPVHGSILKTKTGSPSGQSKLKNHQATENQGSKTKQQQEDTCEPKTPISECLESKKKLTKLVTACFKTLNTYGAGNDSLEASVMFMQKVLGRFDYEQVKKAFEVHMTNSPDMPKPADIVKIIEPQRQKKHFCKVTFLEIKRKKRENVFTTFQEDRYLEDFVRASVSGDFEGAEDVIKQAKIEDKRYWLEN